MMKTGMFSLRHRRETAPAPVEESHPDRHDDVRDVAQEQDAIENVDSSIRQATEALSSGRDSIARSFYAQSPSESLTTVSDPRVLLEAGRDRILNQVKRPREIHAREKVEYGATLNNLNSHLASHLARLTDHVSEGAVPLVMIEAQIRVAVETYLKSVEQLFTRININVQ